MAIGEYYQNHGVWPKNNKEAGLPDAHDIIGKFTEHVAASDDVIEINYGHDSGTTNFNEKVELTATDNAGSISWACANAGNIQPKHQPTACN